MARKTRVQIELERVRNQLADAHERIQARDVVIDSLRREHAVLQTNYGNLSVTHDELAEQLEVAKERVDELYKEVDGLRSSERALEARNTVLEERSTYHRGGKDAVSELIKAVLTTAVSRIGTSGNGDSQPHVPSSLQMLFDFLAFGETG